MDRRSFLQSLPYLRPLPPTCPWPPLTPASYVGSVGRSGIGRMILSGHVVSIEPSLSVLSDSLAAAPVSPAFFLRASEAPNRRRRRRKQVEGGREGNDAELTRGRKGDSVTFAEIDGGDCGRDKADEASAVDRDPALCSFEAFLFDRSRRTPPPPVPLVARSTPTSGRKCGNLTSLGASSVSMAMTASQSPRSPPGKRRKVAPDSSSSSRRKNVAEEEAPPPATASLSLVAEDRTCMGCNLYFRFGEGGCFGVYVVNHAEILDIRVDSGQGHLNSSAGESRGIDGNSTVGNGMGRDHGSALPPSLVVELNSCSFRIFRRDGAEDGESRLLSVMSVMKNYLGVEGTGGGGGGGMAASLSRGFDHPRCAEAKGCTAPAAASGERGCAPVGDTQQHGNSESSGGTASSGSHEPGQRQAVPPDGAADGGGSEDPLQGKPEGATLTEEDAAARKGDSAGWEGGNFYELQLPERTIERRYEAQRSSWRALLAIEDTIDPRSLSNTSIASSAALNAALVSSSSTASRCRLCFLLATAADGLTGGYLPPNEAAVEAERLAEEVGRTRSELDTVMAEYFPTPRPRRKPMGRCGGGLAAAAAAAGTIPSSPPLSLSPPTAAGPIEDGGGGRGLAEDADSVGASAERLMQRYREDLVARHALALLLQR